MTQKFNFDEFSFSHAELDRLLGEIKLLADEVRQRKGLGQDEVVQAVNDLNRMQQEHTEACLHRMRGLVNVVKQESSSKQAPTESLEEFSELIDLTKEWSTIIGKKQAELTTLRETPVAELTRVASAFTTAVDVLQEQAQLLGIAVPWQIRYMAEMGSGGTVELKGGRITDKDGNNIWESKCCVLGHQIQDGAVGEHEPRYHCTEVENTDCSCDVYLEIQNLRAAIESSLELERSESPLMKMLLKLFPHLYSHWSLEENIQCFQHIEVIEGNSMASRISKAFSLYSNRLCLGIPQILLGQDASDFTEYEGYYWKTFAKVGRECHAIARFLVSTLLPSLLSLPSESNEPEKIAIGLTGLNSIEFFECDVACCLANTISIGLHTTYEDSDLRIVIEASGLRAIVCDDLMRPQIQRIAQSLSHVRWIMFMHSRPTSEEEHFYAGNSMKCISLLDILSDASRLDSANELEIPTDVPGSDIFTVLYTSGTSGQPKGVIYTEKILQIDTEHAMHCKPLVNISFIPLSHSTDRLRIWETMQNGGRVGFCNYQHTNWNEHETIKKEALLKEDELNLSSPHNGVSELFSHVSRVRPSVLVAPPRIWTGLLSLYHSVAGQQASAEEGHRLGVALMHRLTGTRVLYCATGGAPTSKGTMAWIKKVWPTASFCESYGCSECGGIAMNGRAMEGVAVKLVSLPALGYSTEDKPWPRGEMWVQSKTLSPGYYKNKSATEQAFKDGWYATGDICSIELVEKNVLEADEKTTNTNEPKSFESIIRVLDRVGSVVTLPNGRAYCPNRLESIFGACPFIDQICVHHETASSDLIAIVSLAHPYTRQWLMQHNENNSILNSIGESQWPPLVHAVRLSCLSLALESNLHDFEMPKHFHLTWDEWSHANHFLTISFKIVRRKIIQFYGHQVKALVDRS